jgi:hypothetical protein
MQVAAAEADKMVQELEDQEDLVVVAQVQLLLEEE